MNVKFSPIELDILRTLYLQNENNTITQREIAKLNGISLGAVNSAIKKLKELNLINSNNSLQRETIKFLEQSIPKNAIILAAGFGMRMVPINMVYPKAMLEVNGEVLIERIIRQLHNVGITEIHIVVGFMKDTFEYLIDEYGVDLIVNNDYAGKENLHSLNCAKKFIKNTYIISSDTWFKESPFNRCEPYSWYLVEECKTGTSKTKVNRNREIVLQQNANNGTVDLMEVAYINEKTAKEFVKNIDSLIENDDLFWEDALFTKKKPFKMLTYAKFNNNNAVGINTYEQLCALDSNSESVKSDAIDVLANIFNVERHDIRDIEVLKKGMTNRSFLFKCKDDKFIMRIPGEGTSELINRTNEFYNYEAIKDKGICDDIIYFDVTNGYKVTKFIENARCCDSTNEEDVKKCMLKLKQFHQLGLYVEHEFDIFQQINLYEQLWEGDKSIFRDYEKTKKNIFALKSFIDNCKKEKCLSHIDAIADNFLIFEGTNGEEIRIIDWEYAGMQDPHVDIAMFCIYNMYDKEQIDKTVDFYFESICSQKNRAKIYAYIAAAGLLWSNWCEYKRKYGVEFGEYSLRQYRYAKEYYRYTIELINSLG